MQYLAQCPAWKRGSVRIWQAWERRNKRRTLPMMFEEDHMPSCRPPWFLRPCSTGPGPITSPSRPCSFPCYVSWDLRANLLPKSTCLPPFLWSCLQSSSRNVLFLPFSFLQEAFSYCLWPPILIQMFFPPSPLNTKMPHSFIHSFSNIY